VADKPSDHASVDNCYKLGDYGFFLSPARALLL
jgi:hypothetical protein